MSLELYLAFVAATAVLILIPGPAVALIVANALAHGTRGALVSVAGVSTAVVGQGNKFELWDEDTWIEKRDAWLAEEDDGDLPPDLESISF